MIGLVSWFIGLQLRVAPGFVGFRLILMPIGFTPGLYGFAILSIS